MKDKKKNYLRKPIQEKISNECTFERLRKYQAIIYRNISIILGLKKSLTI